MFIMEGRSAGAQEYHAIIRKEPALLAVEKNTIGSRPKEMFEDVIEEAEAQLEKDKALLRGAIKEANLDVTPATTFADFCAALGPSRIDPQIAEAISTMSKPNKYAPSVLLYPPVSGVPSPQSPRGHLLYLIFKHVNIDSCGPEQFPPASRSY